MGRAVGLQVQDFRARGERGMSGGRGGREVKVRLGAEVCRDCFLPKQGAVCRGLEPVNEEATTANLFKTVPTLASVHLE